jgi:hypothetical protein
MSTFDDHVNLGYSLVTVAPAPAGSGGSLTVSSSATFPTAPFNCTVWPPNVLPLQSNAEIVRVTAIVGDVLSITRAQEGTSAKSIAVGWQVANTITVKVIDDIQDAITAIETDAVIIDPDSSTRNVIEPTGDFIALALKASLGQTADLLQFQDNAGSLMVAVSAGGKIGQGPIAAAPVAYIDSNPTVPLVAGVPDVYGSTVLKQAIGMRIFPTGENPTVDEPLAFYQGAQIGVVGPDTDDIIYGICGIDCFAEFRGTKPDGAFQAFIVFGGRFSSGDYSFWPDGDDATGRIQSLMGGEFAGVHSGANTVQTVSGIHAFAQATTQVGVTPGPVTLKLAGVISEVILDGTVSGTIPAIYGLDAFRGSAAQAITAARGIRVNNFGGSGTVDSYALYIAAQSGSTRSWSIVSLGGESLLQAGAATQVPLTLKGAAAQSANLLNLTSSAGVLLTAFSETGVLEFGSAGDVNLYRSAADTLKTDDALIVALALSHLGTTLGLLGATPVVQQAASSISALWTGLKNYGLLTAGSTAPTVIVSGDAAGGDLTGTYPNPTLAAIGAATGPIGGATTVPIVTIDAKGRVTALTSTTISGVAPGGAAGGVLSGTYPNPGFAVDMATQAELDAATKFATPADLTAAGITMTMTAGEALAFGDPVYVKNDGKAWKADANGAATYPAIGLAAASVSANASVSILVHGEARSDSAWNWTVGGIIYLSTSAGLTQTQPSATNDVIQVLGVALSADVMYVSPDLFYITHV